MTNNYSQADLTINLWLYVAEIKFTYIHVPYYKISYVTNLVVFYGNIISVMIYYFVGMCYFLTIHSG